MVGIHSVKRLGREIPATVILWVRDCKDCEKTLAQVVEYQVGCYGQSVVILLCDGSMKSQPADIKTAKEYREEMKISVKLEHHAVSKACMEVRISHNSGSW